MPDDDFCSKLEELLKTVSYDIRKCEAPKYLSCFGICEKNIILIHKWDKSQETYHPEKYLDTPSYSEFDVTGNPLECPFTENTTLDNSVFVKLKTEEDCHAPLNVTEARRCLGISNLYLKPQLPVWVLTAPEGNASQALLGCEFKNGWCFQSWATIQGMQAVTDNINSMITEHKKMALLPKSQVNSRVTSIYGTFEDSEIGSSIIKEVTLEVSWHKPSYEVPFDEADTLVIVKTMVGSKGNVTSPMWNQVLLLNKYLDTIVKWKMERSQLPFQRGTLQIPSIKDVFSDSIKSTQPLMDRVQLLLKTSNQQSLAADFPENKTKELKKPKEIIEALTSNQCSGQDFTYKLWSLLIEANSYQELASSMQFVFSEVKNQLVNLYILRSNKTRLARSLHNARFDINAELMHEPLELLLELGIEKIKYDYLYVFNQLQLVSNRNQLGLPDLPSFSNTLSTEWESTVKSWLNWFARLHTMLDMVCLTEEKLGSNIGTLTSVFNVVLETYMGSNSPVMSIEDIISNPLQEIKAAVKTTDVNDHIGKGCQFHKWLLSLTSSSPSRTVTSRYLLSTSPPFPENIVKNIKEEDTFENTVCPDETVLIYGKESLYYSAKLITIGDKFL